MNVLALILFIIVIAMIWLIEGPEAKKSKLGKNAGVVVVGPLYSVSARGTIAKTFTFRIWKGIQYCCEWFKPANPKKPKQVNIRTGLKLIVEKWHTFNEEVKGVWKKAASGKKYTGMNLLISRGLKEYIKQLTIDVKPVSFTIAGELPNETWTWSAE